MTDRYYALTVVLDRDIREDDAEPLIEAIKMLKGVLEVKPVIADDALSDYCTRLRVVREIEKKLWDVLYPKDK